MTSQITKIAGLSLAAAALAALVPAGGARAEHEAETGKGIERESQPMPERNALSLEVEEGAGDVAILIVAHSPVAQTVSYDIELVGSSRSKHRGSTTVPANERSVLSTLRTSHDGEWCARVAVTEADGRRYDLDAGKCD